MRALAPLVLVLAFCGSAAAQSSEGAWALHWQVRDFVVRSHGAQQPDGGVLLLGDSITEGNAVKTLCGRPVVNGGLGGATAYDVAVRAASYVAWTKPAIVVVMAGTYDALMPHWIDSLDTFEAWRQYHAGSVVAARAVGAKIILVTIPPTEPFGIGSSGHDGMRLWLSSAIEFLGQAWSLSVVAPTYPAHPTTDGVHLTPAAYRVLNAAIETACP